MDLPVLNGIIDRRILINYRIKPKVVKSVLPPHLEPLVTNGYASGGICLLRLKSIGVKYSPSFLRITSENAAHRFLISYRKDNQLIKGAYIPRRDTDSKLNVLLAGKVFSWPHYPASFMVEEVHGDYSVRMKSNDGHSSLQVKAQLTDTFPSDSMFDSIDHASSHFQECSIGISPSTKPQTFKIIQLKTKTWSVKPLYIQALKSNYFEDDSIFPNGSIHFDNALLMEGIEHEWLSC